MSGWMKIVLGVVLSLGICGGVGVFVTDLHLMRPYYDASEERCPEDTLGRDESRLDCPDDYRRIMDRSDAQDRWVGFASGIGAVALFWLLLNLLYFRPRRRREQGGQI